VILTALELDVFTAVGSGAAAALVARKLGTDARATEMLLNALAAMKLLQKREGAFYNAPVASRYLAEGGRDDARVALMHTVALWTRWSTLTECVRAGLPLRARSRRSARSAGRKLYRRNG